MQIQSTNNLIVQQHVFKTIEITIENIYTEVNYKSMLNIYAKIFIQNITYKLNESFVLSHTVYQHRRQNLFLCQCDKHTGKHGNVCSTDYNRFIKGYLTDRFHYDVLKVLILWDRGYIATYLL